MKSKAVNKLEQKTSIKPRKHCRISSTIQYLKLLKFNIIIKGVGDKKPMSLVSKIQKTLQERKELITPIIVYTKSNCPNSGAAIVITDGNDDQIWSGGLVVRADGNNFIRASITIKACPKGVSMILRMDSKAAIGALSKGHVSERKRVRTAGRAWVNFCRYEMLEKNQDIMIQHVSSHKGTETTEQRGNDAADIISNEYRRIGESSSARPYFTAAEEQFVLNQNGTNVQGDPRRFLKSIEIQHMKEIW